LASYKNFENKILLSVNSSQNNNENDSLKDKEKNKMQEGGKIISIFIFITKWINRWEEGNNHTTKKFKFKNRRK